MYSNTMICEILKYINQNINKDITILELSSFVFYDKTYIMKKFKSEIGISIHDYINSIRIYNSLKYFKNDNYILNIALNNGFQSLEYFSETFKKYIGVSPRIYKYFISFSPNLKIEDEYTIRESINKLVYLNNKVDRYLTNIKPSGVLSKKKNIKF